jgi:hypothetical protein
MHVHEYIRHDDKAAARLAPKGDGGRFDLYIAADFALPCAGFPNVSVTACLFRSVALLMIRAVSLAKKKGPGP